MPSRHSSVVGGSSAARIINCPGSPAGVEKVLGKKTKLPDGITTIVSSGTTIAPVSDKRPAISGDPNSVSKILLEVLGEDG